MIEQIEHTANGKQERHEHYVLIEQLDQLHIHQVTLWKIAKVEMHERMRL